MALRSLLSVHEDAGLTLDVGEEMKNANLLRFRSILKNPRWSKVLRRERGSRANAGRLTRLCSVRYTLHC